MADHAPNYTPRLKLRYQSKGAIHTLVWRDARSEDDPTALTAKMVLFLNAIAEYRLDDWTAIGLEWAEVDSDIFLPLAIPSIDPGETDDSTYQVSVQALHLSFPGRTALGKRAIFYLYGVGLTPFATTSLWQDFRINNAESAVISAATAVLNETGHPIRGNDGATVTFKPYANGKFNDHWVRRRRNG